MFELNCRVCDKPLHHEDQLKGLCMGTDEQKKERYCALNNPWFDVYGKEVLKYLEGLPGG